VKFEIDVKEEKEYLLIDIGLNGVMKPEEIGELVLLVENTVNNKYFGKGVVISGRLPIWAHSALAHLFHPARFIAHYDPRLRGAVIVATHSPDYKIGEVISIEL